ncbi:MAG: hypothetical protein ACFE0Q_05205 [Anaerolineae bacterium]
MRRIVLLILCLVWGVFGTFAQEDEPFTDQAQVNEVTFDPISFTVTITGDLPDSCTEVDTITPDIDAESMTITLTVTTTRPADAMCATVLTPFEVTYTLDADDLTSGAYTLTVNDQETSALIVTACPQADEDDDLALFDDLGMCFLYPAEYDLFSGDDFVLISQPLTDGAILLIELNSVDADATLDDLRDSIRADEDTLVNEVVIGRQEALLVETDNTREARLIADERQYTFLVEPLDADTDDIEILWATVIDTLFFPPLQVAE